MNIRLTILGIIFCLAFAVAVVRLVELQFYRSEELTDYRENRLRLKYKM